MSNIWNPHAFGVTGQPVGPQVNTLRVYGAEPSEAQLATAQHAFAQFCSTSRLSAVPNPMEQGRLPDGTQYRIVALGPMTIMHIWPSGEGPDDLLSVSGFVFLSGAGEGAMDIVDAVTERGQHTGRWKFKRLSAEDFAALYRDWQNGALRTSIKGAGGLPYSVDGCYTYGRKTFDRDWLRLSDDMARVLALSKDGPETKVYSLTSVPSPGGRPAELVCTVTTLAGAAIVGGEAPEITSQVEVTVTETPYFYSYYDYAFSGTQVLAEVYNPVIAPPLDIDIERKIIYLDNPGRDYHEYKQNVAYLPEPGEPIDGPTKFGTFRRSGDGFSPERDLSLPEDIVKPPLAAYELTRYAPQPKPYRARKFFASYPGQGISVACPDQDLLNGEWHISNLRWLESIYFGLGYWAGDAHQQQRTGGDAHGTLSHTRHRHLMRPEFDFGDTLAECVMKEEYAYDIASSGNRTVTIAGAHVSGLMPYGDSGPTSGTIDEENPATGIQWWSGDQTTVNDLTLVQTSSALATCDVFGRTFVLAANTVSAEISETGDSFSPNLGRGGPGEYSHARGHATVRSKALARNIHVYDPYLGLLCYSEYESTLIYSVDSSFDSSTDTTGVATGAAHRSAGPRSDAVVVTRCRVVVEQHGTIKKTVEVPPTHDHALTFHPLIAGSEFDSPAVSVSAPGGNLHSVPQIAAPVIAPKGREIAIVHPISAAVGFVEFSLAGVRFWKSPATGATLLRIVPEDGAPTLLAINVSETEEISAVLASLDIPGSSFEMLTI